MGDPDGIARRAFQPHDQSAALCAGVERDDSNLWSVVGYERGEVDVCDPRPLVRDPQGGSAQDVFLVVQCPCDIRADLTKPTGTRREFALGGESDGAHMVTRAWRSHLDSREMRIRIGLQSVTADG